MFPFSWHKRCGGGVGFDVFFWRDCFLPCPCVFSKPWFCLIAMLFFAFAWSGHSGINPVPFNKMY